MIHVTSFSHNVQMPSEIVSHLSQVFSRFTEKHLHIWKKSEMTHFTAAFDSDDARMTVKMQGIFNELWKRARQPRGWGDNTDREKEASQRAPSFKSHKESRSNVSFSTLQEHWAVMFQSPNDVRNAKAVQVFRDVACCLSILDTNALFSGFSLFLVCSPVCKSTPSKITWCTIFLTQLLQNF